MDVDKELYAKLLREKIRRWEENNWHLSRTPDVIMKMYADLAKLGKS